MKNLKRRNEIVKSRIEIQVYGADKNAKEEITKVIKEHYPDAGILFGSHDFDNEGDPVDQESGVMRFGIDNAAIGVFQIDEEGVLRYVNNYAAAKLGYDIEELTGMSIFDIDPQFNPEVFRKHREEARAESVKTFISRHRRKDGSEFPVEVTTDYFRFRGKLYSFSFARDITDRVEAEEALRASEEKFRSLVEQAAEMIFLHDMNGKILNVNKAAVESTGYSRNELQNMTVFDIDPDATDRGDMMRYWHSIKTGDPAIVYEGTHRKKDGTAYHAEIAISKVVFLDKEYILALAKNISKRKEYEEELHRLKESLQKEVKKKTRELKERINELERFRDATINRELRIKELRDEIGLLKRQLSDGQK